MQEVRGSIPLGSTKPPLRRLAQPRRGSPTPGGRVLGRLAATGSGRLAVLLDADADCSGETADAANWRAVGIVHLRLTGRIWRGASHRQSRRSPRAAGTSRCGVSRRAASVVSGGTAIAVPQRSSRCAACRQTASFHGAATSWTPTGSGSPPKTGTVTTGRPMQEKGCAAGRGSDAADGRGRRWPAISRPPGAPGKGSQRPREGRRRERRRGRGRATSAGRAVPAPPRRRGAALRRGERSLAAGSKSAARSRRRRRWKSALSALVRR